MKQEINVTRSVVEFKTEEGKVLLEAPLLELYYEVSMIKGNISQDIGPKEKGQSIADALNETYNCEISWAEALYLALQIQDKMAEEKKNID